MRLNEPIPRPEQLAAVVMMLRLALFAAGAIATAMFPLLLLLMMIRDRVGGCNWGTSDIAGTASWEFVPPQLTCSWRLDQLGEINEWAAATNGEEVRLEAGAVSVSEQIPVTAVAWFAFGLFVFGLLLLRFAIAYPSKGMQVNGAAEQG